MSIWDSYPEKYRKREVEYIINSVSSGNSVSIIGLSGSGKSNLLGYIYHRVRFSNNNVKFIIVDCNRLIKPSPMDFFRLMAESVTGERRLAKGQRPDYRDLTELENELRNQIAKGSRMCFLIDRFEVVAELQSFQDVASNMRSLRDAFKYDLTYVTATRKPLNDDSELAELFFGNYLWLGALSREDALWSAKRDAKRFRQNPDDWDMAILNQLVDISRGYPSMLRACCEAYAAGEELSLDAMAESPGVKRRAKEFWKDEPSELMLEKTGLINHPLLSLYRQVESHSTAAFDTVNLTQKENLLLVYLVTNEGQVCEKDDLVQAVWPEDMIYEIGIRDDSLAQLVRRLRKKIEPNPSNPKYIQTIPGRGYIYRSGDPT